jgi:antitoxin SocA-like protein
VEVSYDEGKFTEMLLYVADKLRDDKAGGATKLNKVLYFAEFAHVRQHGHPITGADYQKLQHGPAPRRLLPVRQHLIDSVPRGVHTEAPDRDTDRTSDGRRRRKAVRHRRRPMTCATASRSAHT